MTGKKDGVFIGYYVGGTDMRKKDWNNEIAMLSGVLSSARAVQVNIAIMRSFVKLREVLATHKDLVLKLEELEKKYDAQFQTVFDARRQILAPPEKPKHGIGFHVKEPVARYKARKNLK